MWKFHAGAIDQLFQNPCKYKDDWEQDKRGHDDAVIEAFFVKKVLQRFSNRQKDEIVWEVKCEGDFPQELEELQVKYVLANGWGDC